MATVPLPGAEITKACSKVSKAASALGVFGKDFLLGLREVHSDEGLLPALCSSSRYPESTLQYGRTMQQSNIKVLLKALSLSRAVVLKNVFPGAIFRKLGPVRPRRPSPPPPHPLEAEFVGERDSKVPEQRFGQAVHSESHATHRIVCDQPEPHLTSENEERVK